MTPPNENQPPRKPEPGDFGITGGDLFLYQTLRRDRKEHLLPTSLVTPVRRYNEAMALWTVEYEAAALVDADSTIAILPGSRHQTELEERQSQAPRQRSLEAGAEVSPEPTQGMVTSEYSLGAIARPSLSQFGISEELVDTYVTAVNRTSDTGYVEPYFSSFRHSDHPYRGRVRDDFQELLFLVILAVTAVLATVVTFVVTGESSTAIYVGIYTLLFILPGPGWIAIAIALIVGPIYARQRSKHFLNTPEAAKAKQYIAALNEYAEHLRNEDYRERVEESERRREKLQEMQRIKEEERQRELTAKYGEVETAPDLKIRRHTEADYWRQLKDRHLEMEIGHLYTNLGYDVRVTYPVADDGVDVVLSLASGIAIIQCKGEQKSIGQPVVMELIGAKSDQDADAAILVSTSGFTRQAQQTASRNDGVKLIGPEQLVELGDEAEQHLLANGGQRGTLTIDNSPRCPKRDCRSEMRRARVTRRGVWWTCAQPGCSGEKWTGESN